MITGAELISRIDGAWPAGTTRSWFFPFTYLTISDEGWPVDEAEREFLLARRIELSVAEIRDVCNRLYLRLVLRRPDEPTAPSQSLGEFWLRELTDTSPRDPPAPTSAPAVLHFHGYKGGQGRSSVLGMLAKVLADEGWRVLAIDVDAEAPSLDVLFGVRPTDFASTMTGVRAGLDPTPLRVFTASRADGWVDLLAFRPYPARYDLEAAALAMEGSIFPFRHSEMIGKLRPVMGGYDVVFVDHRTGLAPGVLPWLHGMVGSLVAFARMDWQWSPARRHIGELWRACGEDPGVLVSPLPYGEDEAVHLKRVMPQATALLQKLAEAVGRGAEGEPADAEVLTDHWLLWPADPAFQRGVLPEPSQLGGPVLAFLRDLRRLLGLTAQNAGRPAEPKLHPSGGADEGYLIQTKALRELSAPNSPYAYILGRKGTGKTRLVRALADRSLGEALLVPQEMAGYSYGLHSDAAMQKIIDDCAPPNASPDRFWWLLLAAALTGPNTERASTKARAESLSAEPDLIAVVRAAAARTAQARTFLVDGLELAFPRQHTFDFLASLFRVTALVDADAALRDRVRIRVFIRNDLAERGFENFEQQSHGRRLHLLWDTQSIFNFALSRVEQLPWFAESFPQEVSRVRAQLPRLLEGEVGETECDALLLDIFPRRLARLNINMSTFLRTYFSDDPKGEKSFYPRVYDEFLRVVAGAARDEFGGPKLRDGRIAQELIYFAHERATASFLEQVKSELVALVEPERDLTSLLAVLRNTITPFILDERISDIASRTGLEPGWIRQAMERMRALGMFADRPKYPGQWRAGRLFKSSLGMLYDRRRGRDDDP